MKKISILLISMFIVIISHAQIITSITIDSSANNISVGQSIQLTTNILPVDALNDSLIWTSSNTSIATVNQTGFVTAISIGTVAITATATDGSAISVTKTLTVTSNLITAITMSYANYNLVVGETSTLTYSISPANLSGASLDWTTSNSAVVSVSTTGILTAIAPGTAVITATATDGGGISTSCNVTVSISSQLVTAILISPQQVTMNATQQQILTATVLPDSAINKNVTWTSSNPNIATVDSLGKVTAIIDGTTTITATSKDGTNITASVIVTVISGPIAVTGVQILNSSISVLMGAPQTIGYTILPSTATNKGVTWTSSNITVATVDSTGRIIPIAIGSTTITVTTIDGALKDSINVTVVDGNILITQILFPQTSYDISLGANSITLIPNIIPTNASNKNLIWTSSDTSVAIVNDLGMVIPIALGTTVITVTSTDSSNVSGTTIVNVVNDLPSITISQTNAMLQVNDTVHLYATANPASTQMVWTSSNVAVASVVDGIVTAHAAGTAVISVTESGTLTTATCTITVQQPIVQVTSISLSQSSLQLAKSQYPIKLYVNFSPYNATNKNVQWYSSDSTIAFVNSNGEIFPKGIGTVTITAISQDGSYSASCVISVYEIQASTIVISNTSLQLQVNASATIFAKIIPINASNKAVYWSSTNPNIASVDSSGRIIANTIGTVSIIVQSYQGTGLADTCIVTVVDESIILKQQLPNVTIALGTTTNQSYKFADYFGYAGTSEIHYTANSSNRNIAQAIVSGNSFGIIAYSAGTTNISVNATTCSGISQTLEFTVSVTPTAITQNLCSSLIVTPQVTPITCAGGNTGSAIVTVSGGTAPYTYKWSNYRSDNIIKNMPAGYYSVIVTDANLCAVIQAIEIPEAPKIQINSNIIPPACGISNGSIEIQVSGGHAPYTYLWDDGTTGISIANKDAGINFVTITDNAGCSQTQSFELNNTNAPIIIVNEILESSCNPNNGSIDITVIGGTGAYTYNWNDQIQTEDRIGLAAGNYNLIVSDENNCNAMLSVTVPSMQFSQPEISLVTVGDTTGNNLIIWEKEYTNVVDFYTIYRETEIAGNFEEIGQVSYNLPSIYEDLTALAQEKSYRYRLSATNFCGHESTLSAGKAEYKTINAYLNIALDSVVISWDSYEGFDFYSYIIYKKTPTGKEEIARVPANINSYTIYTTEGVSSSYFVAIELPKTLDPNGLFKTESGPFILAMSNLAEAETGIADVATSKVFAYPTEVKSNLIVTLDSNGSEVSIISSNGKVVYNSGKVSDSQLIIPVLNFSKGSYFVRIQSGDKIVTTPIIVK